MCVTDDFELYCIMKSLRAHGWSRELPEKNPFHKNKKKLNIILFYLVLTLGLAKFMQQLD